MTRQSPLMAIIAYDDKQHFAHDVAAALGYSSADVVVGTPLAAVPMLMERPQSPRFLIIDIGDRAADVLPEIDALAEHCEAETRVVVIGIINDVGFYRALRSRGVIEYFTPPVTPEDVKAAFLSVSSQERHEEKGQVIAFMSAASGDGASTIALNTAYTLATEHRKSVVLIDMDYQFGMVAKNLDLTVPFGIKELFEHPERGIDTALIQRMLGSYGSSRLRVIAAPNQLNMLPEVPAQLVEDMITILRREFDVIIFDLPHLWTNWISAALQHSQHIVTVAQLWFLSVTHSSRLLASWRQAGISSDVISLVINRSGAKFKEAVSARDFERVCGVPVSYYFSNDIKNVVAAENQGKTLIETSNSLLSRQFKEFGNMLMKPGGALNIATHTVDKNVKSTLLNLRGKR